MTKTREHWIGFALGALDESDHHLVQNEIAENPVVADSIEQLRSQLQLLEDGLDESPAPNGLALRTCAFLDDPKLFAEITTTPSLKEDAPTVSMQEPVAGGRPTLTLMDSVVAIGVCIAVVTIFFPALASSRMFASRMQCENNLRQVGMALHEFAIGNAEKHYPEIAPNGPLSVAGSYAPRLLNAGYLNNPEVLKCTEGLARTTKDKSIPTVEQFLDATDQEVQKLQQSLAGVYSYNLGVQDEGRIKPPVMAGRPLYPVAADVVQFSNGKIAPLGHSDGRFNILFDDGHVEFISLDDLPGKMKQFFINDRGEVAAGLSEDDAVVANGLVHPIPTAN